MEFRRKTKKERKLWRIPEVLVLLQKSSQVIQIWGAIQIWRRPEAFLMIPCALLCSVDQPTQSPCFKFQEIIQE